MALAPAALAKSSGCTNGDLYGAYGALSSGTFTVPGVGAIAGVAITRIEADGEGNVKGELNGMGAGVPVRFTTSGRYTMSDDCTFTLRLTSSEGQTTNYFGVYTVDEILLNQTDTGWIAPIIAKPVTRWNGCQLADVAGSYALLATGSVLAGPLAGPLANVSKVTVAANGILTGNGTFAAAQVGGPLSYSAGAVTVNPDCTLSIRARDSLGLDNTFFGVTVDRGREVYFIFTNLGMAVSGTARRQ
jgi:hypothetical protein